MITDRIKNPSEREDVVFLVAVVVAAAMVAMVAMVVAVVAVVAAAMAADTKTGKIFSIIFAASYISAYFAVTSTVIPLWITGIAILAISEIIFYFEKVKPHKGDSKFWFTAKRKLGCLGEASLIVVNAVALLSQVPNVAKWFSDNYNIIAYWFGVVGIWIFGAVLIGLAIYAYIWFNSLKYGRKKL